MLETPTNRGWILTLHSCRGSTFVTPPASLPQLAIGHESSSSLCNESRRKSWHGWLLQLKTDQELDIKSGVAQPQAVQILCSSSAPLDIICLIICLALLQVACARQMVWSRIGCKCAYLAQLVVLMAEFQVLSYFGADIISGLRPAAMNKVKMRIHISARRA